LYGPVLEFSGQSRSFALTVWPVQKPGVLVHGRPGCPGSSRQQHQDQTLLLVQILKVSCSLLAIVPYKILRPLSLAGELVRVNAESAILTCELRQETTGTGLKHPARQATDSTP